MPVSIPTVHNQIKSFSANYVIITIVHNFPIITIEALIDKAGITNVIITFTQ